MTKREREREKQFSLKDIWNKEQKKREKMNILMFDGNKTLFTKLKEKNLFFII